MMSSGCMSVQMHGVYVLSSQVDCTWQPLRQNVSGQCTCAHDATAETMSFTAGGWQRH